MKLIRSLLNCCDWSKQRLHHQEAALGAGSALHWAENRAWQLLLSAFLSKKRAHPMLPSLSTWKKDSESWEEWERAGIANLWQGYQGSGGRTPAIVTRPELRL